MPAMAMLHERDPRDEILQILGSVDEFELFNNQVLCVIYERPEKTAFGLYLPDQNRDEDKIQGKVGLVVKMGPTAFDDPEGKWFKDMNIALGDWVVFRPSDGWSIDVNKKRCRILDDVNIRGRVSHPDMVW